MTDPFEITQVVLARLGDLIKKLPPELVIELYEGTAKLEVVGKSGRKSSQKAPAKPSVSVDVDQVKRDLARIDDRAAAARYIDDLKLTVPQYRALAKELGVTVGAKDRKDVVIQQVVHWTVGRRLASEAISRPAPSRV